MGPSAKGRQEAAKQNETGLKYYADWELENAITAFKGATSNDPDNPEYHLNLARAYARSGSYDEAMRSLGDYLHVETDEALSDRYERLFSSALDGVESSLITGMSELELPVPLIGKAMQMWLEYRLTIGRQPLNLTEPTLWAAALTHLVCKLNFLEISRTEVADAYHVELAELRQISALLIETLDLIPADYRYFIGEKNPLDEVFEAARRLEELYQGLDAD